MGEDETPLLLLHTKDVKKNNSLFVWLLLLLKLSLKIVMWVLFLAWILLIYLYPSDFGSQLVTEWVQATQSTFLGITGSLFLLFSAPILIIAILAGPYLFFSREEHHFKRRRRKHASFRLWTFPLLVDGPFGPFGAISEDRQNLIFRVTCSKGTYIRSLCADLGKALGSCAHLTALRRDSIGEYSADDAWEFNELEEAITKGYF